MRKPTDIDSSSTTILFIDDVVVAHVILMSPQSQFFFTSFGLEVGLGTLDLGLELDNIMKHFYFKFPSGVDLNPALEIYCQLVRIS